MLRSMFSGVSGLRAHQTMMDVVGNNIANVNTAGYKSDSVVFADTLSQLTKAAGAPTNAAGGTNPSQVGLGVRVQAIAQNMSQGSAQATGKATDLMLQGDGMFAIQQGDGTFYSRNGSFTLDANGSIVTNDGGYVMGWKADAAGVVNQNAQIGKLVIPSDSVMPAQVTTTSTFKGNLDRTFKAPTTALAADNPAFPGTVVKSSFVSYDAQGTASTITVTYTNVVDAKMKGTGATPVPATDTYSPTNKWNVTATDANGVAVPLANPATPTVPLNPATVTFGTDGSASALNQLSAAIPMNGTSPSYNVKLDMSGLTGFVSTTGTSTVNPTPNGAPIGTLTSYAFGTDGVITGNYSNGYKQTLGQLAVATFNNSAGLRKEGNSLYAVSTNSGNPVYGIAGQAGRGGLLAGSLEMSNVDLSSEFTELILAQRGFQANSKVITASDEILQDLVNLKR